MPTRPKNPPGFVPHRDRKFMVPDYVKTREANRAARKAAAARTGEDYRGRAWTYGRASTGRQQLSIDAQESKTEGYYHWRLEPDGLPFAGFVSDEDTSGRIPFRERTNGAKLFAELQPGDHLICTRPDRAFRNLADCFSTLELWQKIGVHVHFVDYGIDTTTAMGQLMIGFLALFAQWERQQISERTRTVNDERRKQGLAVSSPPLGYKIDKVYTGRKDGHNTYRSKLVIEDYVMRLMRRIWMMDKNGDTHEVISRKLVAAGVANRKGVVKWSSQAVWKWKTAYAKLLAAGSLPPEYQPPNPDSPDSSGSRPPSPNTP